jgi:hypothetical protein
MSETVRIGRFHARYHLRPSQFAQARRLDSLMRDVTGEALELALERAGIRANEMVCIRGVHVNVRVRLSRGDSAVVADWARLVAQAIRDAAADSHNAVRYRSLPLALIDLGARIAAGRFDRVWAWRQLGLWQDSGQQVSLSTAANEFAGALTRQPKSAVSVLAALASQGLLKNLAAHLDEGWLEIAGAVLQASGVAGQLRLAAPEQRTEARAGEVVEVVEVVNRTLERSHILKDCRSIPLTEPSPTAVALLALLEIEPSLVQAGGARLFDAVRALHKCAFSAALPPEASAPGAAAPPGVTGAARPGVPVRPMRAPERMEHVAGERILEHAEATLREEATSEFGGLLFLLHLLEELAIPERALASADISVRGLRWFLHRLALTLQPLDAGDAAALAFCGLPPDALNPSYEQPAPSPEEEKLIAVFADEVRIALSNVLPEPPRTPPALMQFVCRRRARVIADPGWIELHFDLLDVSTEIRHAGLDLDPGWVPWLGAVIRFVYE